LGHAGDSSVAVTPLTVGRCTVSPLDISSCIGSPNRIRLLGRMTWDGRVPAKPSPVTDFPAP